MCVHERAQCVRVCVCVHELPSGGGGGRRRRHTLAVVFMWLSLAPFSMTASALERFPAVAHLDNTTRIQTVSLAENPWLHALLMAVSCHALRPPSSITLAAIAPILLPHSLQ
jgi:hypothetical protein